jgi:hypothetical protein
MRPNDRLVRVLIVVIVALAACFALFSLHPLAGSYFWPTLIITVIVGCTAWAWLIGHRARQRRIIDRVGAEYLWVPPSADLAGFWMMRTPVTNAQYHQAVAAGECRAPLWRTAYDDAAKAQHPVTYVRRADARKYAAWVGVGGCRTTSSGRGQRKATTGARGRGATHHRMRSGRIAVPTAPVARRRWAAIRLGPARTACSTWRATCGNGWSRMAGGGTLCAVARSTTPQMMSHAVRGASSSMASTASVFASSPPAHDVPASGRLQARAWWYGHGVGSAAGGGGCAAFQTAAASRGRRSEQVEYVSCQSYIKRWGVL